MLRGVVKKKETFWKERVKKFREGQWDARTGRRSNIRNQIAWGRRVVVVRQRIG